MKEKIVKKKTASKLSDGGTTPKKKKSGDSSSSKKSPKPSKLFLGATRSRSSLDEISYLKKQLNELVKENRTLKQVQRRQDAALARLEGTNSDMPTLLSRYTEEVRILKEQLRKHKDSNRENERILKERSLQMERLRDKTKKYEQILNSKGKKVLISEKGNAKIQEDLAEKEKRISELEKETELMKKNFKHQFNIEVQRHKDTRRKLGEYATEYEKLTGNTLTIAQFSNRSPRRNPNVESTPRPKETVEAKSTNRSVTKEIRDQKERQRSKTRKPQPQQKSQPQSLSPNRKVTETQSSPKRPSASLSSSGNSANLNMNLNMNSNSKTSNRETENDGSYSPKLTLFADYQRSLASTPKKNSDAQDTSVASTNGRLSSPYNDDLIRAAEQQQISRRQSLSKNDNNVSQKSSLIDPKDPKDSLLDFTNRPLAGNSNLNSRQQSRNAIENADPFGEIKKNAAASTSSAAVMTSSRSKAPPSNALDELFGGNSNPTVVSEKQVQRRSGQNSIDSGLASTHSSPNNTNNSNNVADLKNSNTARGSIRKSILDLDDKELFPLAKTVSNGPKVANGLFPWEQEALAKTKS